MSKDRGYSEHTIRVYDPPDGYYIITDGFMVEIKVRPSKVHRWFCRLLLGWKWVDNN